MQKYLLRKFENFREINFNIINVKYILQKKDKNFSFSED